MYSVMYHFHNATELLQSLLALTWLKWFRITGGLTEKDLCFNISHLNAAYYLRSDELWDCRTHCSRRQLIPWSQIISVPLHRLHVDSLLINLKASSCLDVTISVCECRAVYTVHTSLCSRLGGEEWIISSCFQETKWYEETTVELMAPTMLPELHQLKRVRPWKLDHPLCN